MRRKEEPPTTEEGYALLYDSPLTELVEDQLGRKRFARALARAIADMNATDGFVFGLQGPWGVGKTTLINFVCKILADGVVPLDVELQ